MRTYLVGILFSFAFVFCLSGIKGKALQESQIERSGIEQCANYAEGCLSSLDAGYGAMGLSNCLVLEAFRLKICDARVLSPSFYRGMNASRHLKFISTIRILSLRNTSLSVGDSKSLYFHNCFVKSSYRYFVYTLERLLI